MLGERAFEVTWDGLKLVANCDDRAIQLDGLPAGRMLWGSISARTLDPWSVGWWISP
jgi:hypothetical protein